MPGDYPDVPYLQAEHFGRGRPDGPPLWIVAHTMEEAESGDTAERVANYFAFNTGARTVSSHYTVDSNSEVQCVRLGDVAYTVGNRAGNNRGINYELAGRASQGAADWADPYSQALLRRFARLAARDMDAYAIPNRWCTVADLVARRPGLTTHNDLRLAFGGTTHTDPGGAFPRTQVSALIAGGGEDDMDQEDRLIKNTGSPTRTVGDVFGDLENERNWRITPVGQPSIGGPLPGSPAAVQLAAAQRVLDLPPGGLVLDPDALVAAMVANDDFMEALVDGLAARPGGGSLTVNLSGTFEGTAAPIEPGP